jgi:outer membrane beta-barrel protein
VRIAIVLIWTLLAGSAFAAGPEYSNDPFGDSDFAGAPAIEDSGYPTLGRGEVSLLFATSMIDKYTKHLGGVLDFTYHFSDTMGAALSVGMLNGQLTNIVTDPAGVIGNKITKCTEVGGCDINPDLPDYAQMTGVLDAIFEWAPFYGKINMVSELDASMQMYYLAGLGVNGTRKIEASNPVSAADYTLSAQGFGAGGFLDGMKVNGLVGAGIRFFFLDRLALRAEFRDLVFFDKFDFDKDGVEDSYASHHWFGQFGLSFLLF